MERKFMKTIKKYLNFISEELNTDNTYFTKKPDMFSNLETEVKSLILDISKKLNISLPTESFSKDFISIKKEVEKEIKYKEVYKNYVEEFGQDKDLINSILLKFCTSDKKIVVKNNKNKLNITHLDFKLTDDVDNVETYQVIFPKEIKDYILNNYSINKLDYLIYINCESDKFNRIHFPGRIERWYKSHGKRFGKDEQPQPYKGKHGQWIHDLFDGIPESLRGTGLGYSIYKEFIKFKGYVSSNSWSSVLSQSVWKKLASDSDLHGILVNYDDQNGDIILFSKDYKGDYKKICQDFLDSAKKGKLYRGKNFVIKNIEIDKDLEKKLKS
jgi:hypothetical protein